MDPLQTLILQLSIGLFTAVLAGAIAAVLLVKALRLVARLGRQLATQRRGRRQAAEDARLAEHVDQLLANRMARQLEADTVVMPRLTDAETQWFGPYERDMAPLSSLYLFDDRWPLNDGRHRR